MTDLERYGRRLDLDTLRDQFAPAATDLELEHFALVCRHLDLDPYADQICLIGRNRKVKMTSPDGRDYDGWKLVHRPQITVAGRRAIASRTGRLRGIEGPQWCGPRQLAPDGSKRPLDWAEVWDNSDHPPYAARVLVYVAGWERPANGTAKWSEFAQTTDTAGQHLSPLWKRMPSHMLGKVAESLALRRAFPELDAAVGYAEVETPTAVDLDDAAVLAEASTPALTSADDMPVDVHDEAPEARGYDDPGRPFNDR